MLDASFWETVESVQNEIAELEDEKQQALAKGISNFFNYSNFFLNTCLFHRSCQVLEKERTTPPFNFQPLSTSC